MTYWRNWLHTQCADDPEGKCLAVKLGAEVSDLSEAMRAVLRNGTSQIIERLAGGIEAGLADGSLSGSPIRRIRPRSCTSCGWARRCWKRFTAIASRSNERWSKRGAC